jgi:hypothetical protein
MDFWPNAGETVIYEPEIRMSIIRLQIPILKKDGFSAMINY